METDNTQQMKINSEIRFRVSELVVDQIWDRLSTSFLSPRWRIELPVFQNIRSPIWNQVDKHIDSILMRI